MDLDALTSIRRGEWNRLDELSRKRDLNGGEIDELVTRYRAASADLADMKTSTGRTTTGDAVSVMLSRARLRLTGATENVLKSLPRFFLRQLPAALYRVRWTTFVITVLFLAIVTTTMLWTSSNPDYIASMGSDAQLRDYVENRFTQYYNPAAEFAGAVWTNNAWLAAQCVIFGITGLYPIMLLMANAVGIGQAGAVMAAYGETDTFILHLLPHGLLELTSIFVAGAAGLHMFWAWIAPGRQTRGQALAHAGRSLATIVVGLVLSLALSGIVEGFVTGQQTWPWAVRIGIGVLALAIFLAYMLILGRWATKHGETGDMTEYETGTATLYAG